MANLPIIKTGNQAIDMLQTRWKSQLDPVLASVLSNGSLIENVQLSGSSPTNINHKLGRKQIGWILTDVASEARIWRSQPLNQNTLTLSSDADVVVSLWCF